MCTNPVVLLKTLNKPDLSANLLCPGPAFLAFRVLLPFFLQLLPCITQHLLVLRMAVVRQGQLLSLQVQFGVKLLQNK